MPLRSPTSHASPRLGHLSVVHRQPALVQLQGSGGVSAGAGAVAVGEKPSQFKFGSDLEWSDAFDALD